MNIDPRRVKITTAPTVEPVSATEAKLHLRIDHSTEDTLIDRLIEAARQQCEDVTRRAFVTRTFTAKLDDWPRGNRFVLPYPPLLAVSSITYTDIGGTTATLAASSYIVDAHSEPGQIVLKDSADWPSNELAEVNAITIVFTAGYGANAGNVPDRYRHAMLLIIAHLYENREAVLAGSGVHAMVLPMAVDMLLLTDRGGW